MSLFISSNNLRLYVKIKITTSFNLIQLNLQKKNTMNVSEKKARLVITLLTSIVLGLVGFMYIFPGFESAFKSAYPNFDIYQLPKLNAICNSIVSISLIFALIAIKNKKISMHQNFIYIACFFSFVFLINYVFYHLISENTIYKGEGMEKWIYLFILFTHIILAAVSFPFILLTLYRALSKQFEKHRQIAKLIFPIWLYVAVTGVIVYLMISPFYPQP